MSAGITAPSCFPSPPCLVLSPTSLAHQLNTSLTSEFLPGLPPLWGLSFPQLEACALVCAHLGNGNWIITREIQSPDYFISGCQPKL